MNWILLLVAVVVLLGLFALKRSAFVSSQTARNLLRQGALVVDVRTPDEFNSGHLPGAINLPLGELSNDISRRVPDKNQVMLLHCRSGARSGIARKQLKDMGYRNVFNLGSYGRAENIVREARRE